MNENEIKQNKQLQKELKINTNVLAVIGLLFVVYFNNVIVLSTNAPMMMAIVMTCIVVLLIKMFYINKK